MNIKKLLKPFYIRLKHRIKRSVSFLYRLPNPWALQNCTSQSLLGLESELILGKVQKNTPKNPLLSGYKIYSQVDEDGIIEEIFQRIGTTNKTFVEIGCGEGTENNTHALLHSGWKGVWVDGCQANIDFIKQHLSSDKNHPHLVLANKLITQENVTQTVKQALGSLSSDPQNIDFLSIDIDGNELFLIEPLLTHFKPRLICIEYNARLGPALDLSIQYDPNFTWKKEDYQGASLRALTNEAKKMGYRLVCCNISGVNAFFVENEFADSFGDYTEKDLFQPARYHFVQLQAGHPETLKFLKNKITYTTLS